MKKKYKEPTMMVVCIKGRHQMLSGSVEQGIRMSGYEAGGNGKGDNDGFEFE